MSSRKNVLLVVDLQKQFKDKNYFCEIVKDFVISQQNNYDEIIFTVFSQELNKDDKTFHNGYNKHLEWNDCLQCDENDLIVNPELDIDIDTRVLIKNTYAVNLPEDLTPNNCHIDLVGCDADACVLATTFELWDKQYDFNVLFNFIFTTSPKCDYKQLKLLYKRNFGNIII